MGSKYFPPLEKASEEGILAMGGYLSEEILLDAYQHGIFPWGRFEGELLWWSPDPRMVLFPEEFKLSKSLRSLINKGTFEVRINTQFEKVIRQCAEIGRKDQEDTWIDDEFIEAYTLLNKKSKAFSVETYYKDKLVGGLYGVDMFPVFCGESMFSQKSNASKVALYALVEYLKARHYKLIDVQQETDHLTSLGGRLISRSEFIKYLKI